jgi:hypothetical protein
MNQNVTIIINKTLDEINNIIKTLDEINNLTHKPLSKIIILYSKFINQFGANGCLFVDSGINHTILDANGEQIDPVHIKSISQNGEIICTSNHGLDDNNTIMFYNLEGRNLEQFNKEFIIKVVNKNTLKIDSKIEPFNFINGMIKIIKKPITINHLRFNEYNSNNYPNIAIDINGCVNINKDACFETVNHDFINNSPVLNVNGYAFISNLGVYDYYSKCNLHLDDIYLRKNGLTLKADQIIGGDFANQEFTFNSNVNIGKSNVHYELNVNGSATITNTLETNTLVAYKTKINGIAEFNKTTYFNNITVFNDNITIDKSLNINNDLFINGYRVTLSNLDYANNELNFDYGCNLSISGRFGTGIFNTDTYDHQFNIIKRNKERFELYIQDVSGITADSSKVYMGHTNLNNLNGSIDNSFVILTQKNIKWHNIYFYASPNM